jgi:peptidoglycan biosynthesis protein MviN/MurJ (putative lipid II flippase)
MSEYKTENRAALLALLGALILFVSLFAESFGLGSGNGEFGRWQISGVLGGFCVIAYALFLAMRLPGRAQQAMRRIVNVSLIGAVIVTAGAFARWIFPLPLLLAGTVRTRLRMVGSPAPNS